MDIYRLTILAAALTLAACAQTVVPAPKTGQHYFQEGEAFYAQENYLDAIAAWEKVRESFHSPELTAEADYRIAEAHFLNEDYLEAAVAFESFLEQHPDHARHVDALYYLGIANYRQLLTPDRDQTAARNALVALRNFTSRYPGDKRVAEAREVMAACTTRLAEHELYVGRFYLRTEEHAAAIGRLKTIPTDYPDFPSLDLVYLYLGQAYLRNGQRPEARETFNTLYSQFPDSKAVVKARKTLADEY